MTVSLEQKSKPKIIFVTYAAGRFVGNLANNGWWVKHFMRADKIILLTRADLESDPVYPPNRDVFDAPRGAGFWAWKPWAIRRALAEAGPDDVVVYQDCGFGLRYKNLLPIRSLAKRARAKSYVAGVVMPDYGTNRQWNHRHCLEKTGAYTAEYMDHPVIGAIVSLWTNSPKSVAFVDEWLTFCLDPAVVGDAADPSREDPAFVEHRYDQSILSNLAIKHKASLLRPDATILPFAKSLMLLEVADRSQFSRQWAFIYAIIVAMLRVRDRMLMRKATTSWKRQQ